MTSYTAITDAETDPSAPLTSELAKKWRDNPVAISEGATSAPFVAAGWHPYNGTVVGGANDGEIYDFSTDGVVSSIETPAFVDGYEYLILLSQVDDGGAANQSADELRIELYRETTAAYASAYTLTVNQVNVGGYLKIKDLQAQLHIKRPRDVVNVCFGETQHYAGALATGTLSTASINSFAVYHATAQKIGKAKISIYSGATLRGFGGGKVFLYRRRVF